MGDWKARHRIGSNSSKVELCEQPADVSDI